MKPGDRRKRWNRSSVISAFILSIFGIFVLTSINWEKGALAIICAFIFGCVPLFCAGLEVRDRIFGWKISEKRPPWADKMDAIERRHKKYPNAVWKYDEHGNATRLIGSK